MTASVRRAFAAKIALWPIDRKSRGEYFQSSSVTSSAPAVRTSPATATSAASASQFSIAWMNACLALRAGGTLDSFTGGIRQPLLSMTFLAWAVLEVVESPEDRQPALGVGAGEARQVRGVDNEHGVELEPDARPRFDVSHAGQKQRGQHFAIRQSPS